MRDQLDSQAGQQDTAAEGGHLSGPGARRTAMRPPRMRSQDEAQVASPPRLLPVTKRRGVTMPPRSEAGGEVNLSSPMSPPGPILQSLEMTPLKSNTSPQRPPSSSPSATSRSTVYKPTVDLAGASTTTRGLFERLDVDKSGRLSRKEFAQLTAEIGERFNSAQLYTVRGTGIVF